VLNGHFSQNSKCKKRYDYQETVSEEISQEAARKELKDIADSHGGETLVATVAV